MAPHSSILARKIPWTEELGGLLSLRLQRVRHDLAQDTVYLHVKSLRWQFRALRLLLRMCFSHLVLAAAASQRTGLVGGGRHGPPGHWDGVKRKLSLKKPPAPPPPTTPMLLLLSHPRRTPGQQQDTLQVGASSHQSPPASSLLHARYHHAASVPSVKGCQYFES